MHTYIELWHSRHDDGEHRVNPSARQSSRHHALHIHVNLGFRRLLYACDYPRFCDICNGSSFRIRVLTHMCDTQWFDWINIYLSLWWKFENIHSFIKCQQRSTDYTIHLRNINHITCIYYYLNFSGHRVCTHIITHNYILTMLYAWVIRSKHTTHTIYYPRYRYFDIMRHHICNASVVLKIYSAL